MGRLGWHGPRMSAIASSSSAGGAEKRFPRSARLLRRADFERVYKQGRRHFATHMTVFYLHRPEGGHPRVGFTVGRALGIAVQRNRMKRRLREAVRLGGFAAGLPVDIVINPKKSLLTAEFSAITNEISRAGESIRRKVEAEKNLTMARESSS
jgi:ribonuclease P protein component